MAHPLQQDSLPELVPLHPHTLSGSLEQSAQPGTPQGSHSLVVVLKKKPEAQPNSAQVVASSPHVSQSSARHGELQHARAAERHVAG